MAGDLLEGLHAQLGQLVSVGSWPASQLAGACDVPFLDVAATAELREVGADAALVHRVDASVCQAGTDHLGLGLTGGGGHHSDHLLILCARARQAARACEPLIDWHFATAIARF